MRRHKKKHNSVYLRSASEKTTMQESACGDAQKAKKVRNHLTSESVGVGGEGERKEKSAQQRSATAGKSKSLAPSGNAHVEAAASSAATTREVDHGLLESYD